MALEAKCNYKRIVLSTYKIIYQVVNLKLNMVLEAKSNSKCSLGYT